MAGGVYGGGVCVLFFCFLLVGCACWVGGRGKAIQCVGYWVGWIEVLCGSGGFALTKRRECASSASLFSRTWCSFESGRLRRREGCGCAIAIQSLVESLKLQTKAPSMTIWFLPRTFFSADLHGALPDPPHADHHRPSTESGTELQAPMAHGQSLPDQGRRQINKQVVLA